MGKTKKRPAKRKVGARKLNPSNPLVKLAPIAVGYFFGDKINAPLEKLIGTKVDGKIVGGAEAGIGAYLAFGKGKKSVAKSVVGGLLLGAGAKKLMSEFGIGRVGGPYGRVSVLGNSVPGSPYGRVNVVSGYTPNNALNGYTPNNSLNGRRSVMSGVGNGSGSGMTSSNPGSDYMN